MKDVMMQKGFSIILCTYNGEKRLPQTLEHVSLLIVPENHLVELVLVNNNSNDNTVEVAKKEWANRKAPFELRIIDEKKPGKGNAIETGYDAANCTYILTVDDDNWLRSDYLVNAAQLMESDKKIGILQGKSEGVFENDPPEWVNRLSDYYIIGSPKPEPGYFPKNDPMVWGAGMVIRNEDWRYIRKLGFSFLTSKNVGKAAGEDNETAMALLMLGRNIFYSDQLTYKHYMPNDRLAWDKLEQSFRTFGYVTYYFFLYAMVIDAYNKKYDISTALIRKKVWRFFLVRLKSFNWKHHLGYFLKNNVKLLYRLQLKQNYYLLKWAYKLRRQSMADVKHLQRWMLPILDEHPKEFSLPIIS